MIYVKKRQTNRLTNLKILRYTKKNNLELPMNDVTSTIENWGFLDCLNYLRLKTRKQEKERERENKHKEQM